MISNIRRLGMALCLGVVALGGGLLLSSRPGGGSACNHPTVRRQQAVRGGTIPPNVTTHTRLRSYSYSNCPFNVAKFNLYELGVSSEGDVPPQSTADAMERARRSLELSNDAEAYRRVVDAIESGALNRKIVLDGDSLTRQLFISLSCLAWSAGYVEDYTLGEYDVWTGGENNVLRNFNYTASEKIFHEAHVRLKGGGIVYYIDYFNHADMDHGKMAQRMEHDACGTWPRHRYRTRYTSHGGMLPLDKDDVVVLAAGHHDSSRETYVSGYRDFLECIRNDTNGDNRLGGWPHFFYQLSSVQSFWTLDGEYDSESIPGKDEMTCQPSVSSARLQEQDSSKFDGLVQMIANEINLKDMGEYHLGHGDCLHWIQPGIPDLFAAQLADVLVQRMPEHNCTNSAISADLVVAVVGFSFFLMFLTSTWWVREQTRKHLDDCKILKT